MTETIIGAIGILIILAILTVIFKWFSIYLPAKGPTFKILFETGFYGPSFIPTGDKDFTPESRKLLNRRLGTAYVLFLLFVLLAVLSILL